MVTLRDLSNISKFRRRKTYADRLVDLSHKESYHSLYWIYQRYCSKHHPGIKVIAGKLRKMAMTYYNSYRRLSIVANMANRHKLEEWNIHLSNMLMDDEDDVQYTLSEMMDYSDELEF